MSYRVANVRFSFSSRIGETLVQFGVWAQEGDWIDRAGDSDEQQPAGEFPDAPERWEPGGVEQFLRGKMPGNPG